MATQLNDNTVLKNKSRTEECSFNCNICNIVNHIHPEWLLLIRSEIEKLYFKEIIAFLHNKNIIYPPITDIFSFTYYHKLEDTKVVILGQDPYHNKGQAMGLSFSVNKGCKHPKSLQNIFKEVKSNYKNFVIPTHGSLVSWAKQGVLLLNYVLTVFENQPDSHKKIGWQKLVKYIITLVNDKCDGVVFMIWGKKAEDILTENIIDEGKHLILKASHPSPFSAHKGFFGCMHFFKANAFLESKNITPIKWEIN